MQPFQHIPDDAGTSQKTTRPLHVKEWITVDEAVTYFRDLGLPRSPEAIRGYCRTGKIEATTTQGLKGEQHVLKCESAVSYIEERKTVLAAMSRDIPEDDGTSRKLPVISVSSRHMPEEDEITYTENNDALEERKAEIAKLKEENMSLKIDKAARDQLVTMLREERAQLADTAMEQSRKVGELETRLEISAPQSAAQEDIHNDDKPGGAMRLFRRV